MKKKIIGSAAVLLVIALMLSFVSCSSGGRETSESSKAIAEADAGVMEDAADIEEAALMAQEDATVDNASESADISGDAGSAGGESVATPGAGRKITFSASYTIETKKYDEDYARVNRLVKESGGYIANEETQTHSYDYESRQDGRTSYFTLKIPVGGYDSFLDQLAQIGEVVNKNKSSEDLTSEYFDTEARIEMLEMRKDRLTEYIRNATKAADIVEFEKELSDVLFELDQYQGDKRRLDQLVDYATVNVSLDERITPETIGKDGEPLGNRASEAFGMSLTGVGEFLQNTAVFFAGAEPVIALIAVILVVVWFVVRSIRRARAKSREARRVAGKETKGPVKEEDK